MSLPTGPAEYKIPQTIPCCAKENKPKERSNDDDDDFYSAKVKQIKICTLYLSTLTSYHSL